MIVALIALVGYLIGAIPFGYLVARGAKGIDIRLHGSGNIGATNVGRVLGLRWFFVVFLLDFLKAAVPVMCLLEGWLPSLVPEGWPNSAVASLAGLAILIGNMFPIYLRFRGGKGAATGTGVILPLAPLPAVIAVLTFLVIFMWTRFVSLGSLAASLALIASQLLFHGADAFRGEAGPVSWLCILGAALVAFRHRTNIVRLIRGTENRIPRKAQQEAQ